MHNRENFTAYETIPEDLAIYMSHNGPHFNKEACLFALSNMYTKDKDDNEKEITPIAKKAVDEMLSAYGIKVKNSKLYDSVYVANMCAADYKDSINSEDRMAKFIKETLDDPDGAEGLVFNRWIADMKWLGIPIPWDEFL